MMMDLLEVSIGIGIVTGGFVGILAFIKFVFCPVTIFVLDVIEGVSTMATSD